MRVMDANTLRVKEIDNIPCNTEPKGDRYKMYEYQDDALRYARYPGQGTREGLVYTVLALCGEAGELANKLKKHLRDGTPINESVLADELSDVLWYTAAASRELNRSLGDLGVMNIEKLSHRSITQKAEQDGINKKLDSATEKRILEFFEYAFFGTGRS
jgi:NTP pyrophosphatase (non-canonical NTP hydrolase)